LSDHCGFDFYVTCVCSLLLLERVIKVAVLIGRTRQRAIELEAEAEYEKLRSSEAEWDLDHFA